MEADKDVHLEITCGGRVTSIGSGLSSIRLSSIEGHDMFDHDLDRHVQVVSS